MPHQAEPGWYGDPDDPGRWRWWDGAVWTGHHVSIHRGRPRRAPWPLRAGVRKWTFLSVGLIVALAGALLGGIVIGRSGFPLYWQGRPIAAAGTTLDQAAGLMRAATSRAEGTLTTASRCWFQASSPDGHDVASSLRCGPVGLPVSNDRRAWLTLPLTASYDSRGRVHLRPASPGMLPPAAPPVAPGQMLRDAEGAVPPAHLPLPPVPRVARVPSGFSAVLAADLPGLRPEKANLTAWGASYQVLQAGNVSELPGTADPAALARGSSLLLPPAGERFELVRLRVVPGQNVGPVPTLERRDLSEEIPGQNAFQDSHAGARVRQAVPVPDDVPTVSLVAGGRSVALSLGLTPRTVTVVVALPSGAASLRLKDHGVSESLALSSGRHGPGDPLVLGRGHVTDSASSTTTTVLAGRSLQVSVPLAELSWFAGYDGRVAPPDRQEAWLQVPVMTSAAVPLADWTLGLPDGVQLPATRLDDPDPSTTDLGFVVPAQTTVATLQLGDGSGPGWTDPLRFAPG